MKSDTTTNDKKTSGWYSYSFNTLFLKLKYSFYSALVFFLFANPETMNILQGFFGKSVYIITSHGVTTNMGIIISTSLFFITIFSLMLLPGLE